MFAHEVFSSNFSLCFSFQDAHYLYIGLELVPGGELAAYVKSCRAEKELAGIPNSACNVTCVQFYAAEIIEGLEYLHNNGILHRDLKVRC